ncbi:DUF4404 family protein [Teredinibacter sp. KSP-S5-2]|uniref:DUF4404 family protein n=1 Tax=Teredinibacter sp. KSP-S5-2 TaxID=3034506 RepID=UPI00293426E6|nr:DUF4404 family protein [Teredinibacter sp. KSP-S5-2]WNO11402.1 DUF4404 family protein [Teredinibacter sp. KSP-S5-2]
MPRAKVTNLISKLHETFGDDATSPEQERLMMEINSHMQDWQGKHPEDASLIETVELLVTQLEESHPKSASIAKEIVNVLRDIGV